MATFEHPLVSIVMPSFNNGHLIAKAINSVIAQSYANWELIIVDNHSSDNTCEVVSGYDDDRIMFYSRKNHGIIGKSRNFGIRKSRGDWVAFLDSDDWWCRTKLADCIKKITPDVDVLFHRLWFASVRSNRVFRLSTESWKIKDPAAQDLISKGNPIANSSSVVRKSKLYDVGLISETVDLVGWEDYELWIRIALDGGRFHLIPKTLGYYWIGESNYSTPRRVLTNISKMQTHFNSISDKQLMVSEPSWLNYARGVCHSRLGRPKEALVFFRKAFSGVSGCRKTLKLLMRTAASLLQIIKQELCK